MSDEEMPQNSSSALPESEVPSPTPEPLLPVPEVTERQNSPTGPAADEERRARLTERFFASMAKLLESMGHGDLGTLSQLLNDMSQFVAEAIERGEEPEDVLSALRLRDMLSTQMSAAATPATPEITNAGEKSHAEILSRGLFFDYENNRDLFDTWWNSLPPDLQQLLEVEAEGFPSWNAYLSALLNRDSAAATGPILDVLIDAEYQRFGSGLPPISIQDFEVLMQTRAAVSLE
jgi:hypothetical protein